MTSLVQKKNVNVMREVGYILGLFLNSFNWKYGIPCLRVIGIFQFFKPIDLSACKNEKKSILKLTI